MSNYIAILVSRNTYKQRQIGTSVIYKGERHTVAGFVHFVEPSTDSVYLKSCNNPEFPLTIVTPKDINCAVVWVALNKDGSVER